MSKGSEIFLKSGLVAVICMLVSRFFPPVFYWLGPVLGFVLSWIALTNLEILRASPEAATEASRSLVYVPRWVAWFNRLPLHKRWEYAGGLSYMFSYVVYVSCVFGIFFYFNLENSKTAPALAGVSIISLTVAPLLISMSNLVDYRLSDEEKARGNKRNAILMLPFFFLYFLGIMLGKFLPVIPRFPLLVIRGLRDGMVFLAHFVWNLVRMVHSQERLLILTDGAIGATIAYPTCYLNLGWDFGTSLVAGFIIGGALGVLNFEIVSKRLLHLVPTI